MKRPLSLLGERCPELRVLRDRLGARVIDCDDLPAEWVRLLYGLPASTPIWSRTDALLEANRAPRRRAR
jgi:hypothetical protein